DDSASKITPPDPATFGQQVAAVTPQNDQGPEKPATTETKPAAGAAGAISSKVPEAANAPAPAAPEAAAAPDTHTLLIVGLPIAAVVLLMGVYWMIFRSGGA